MGLFSPKKTEIPAPTLLETPQQTTSRVNVGNYADTYGGGSLLAQGAPYRQYGGEFTAGLTPTETYGQSLLADYARSQAPSIYGATEDQLTKTLTGGFDPRTSEYYQATRDELASNEENQIQALRRSQQLRGAFRGSNSIREEANARSGFQRATNSALGSLVESERNRAMQAVPYSLTFGQAQEQAPLSRLGAVSQYGGLPRNLDQNTLNMQYQDFNRQLGGEDKLLQMMLGISGEPTYYQKQYSTSLSPFQSLLSTINPIYGDVLRGQGANAPGMSTTDIAKIIASAMGGA